MSGLSKLGTGLAVLFAVAVTALFAELVYVLWRRQRFRQRHLSGDDVSFPGGSFSYSSKELLYFFCWKTQTRIEPSGASNIRTIGAPPPDLPPEDVTDVLKWHGLYGPSRFLFTIKEEEREDLESDASSSVDKKQKSNKVSLEECFEVVVTVDVDDDDDDPTPFSTPCASPFYYTPSPSPSREVENGETVVLAGEVIQRESPAEGGVHGDNTVSFIGLEVHSDRRRRSPDMSAAAT